MLTKNKLLVTTSIICGLLFSACEENHIQPSGKNMNEQSDLDKNQIALNVVDLLQDQSTRESVINQLKNSPVGVSLKEIISTVDQNETVDKLRKSVERSEQLLSVDDPEKVEVPEVWLQGLDQIVDAGNLLVAFPPSGNESEWTKVTAYTLDKEVVYLDPFEEPSVPVVVVETSGYQAFKVEVELMNKILRRSGMQRDLSEKKTKRKNASSVLETTKLTKIKLNDDKEPWISGAAEIYAVTSGLRNLQNDPEIAVIPMYYLDHDGITYTPNHIMLFWDDYHYQAANLQLFEKDDNHNYQELTLTIVNSVSEVIAGLGYPTWAIVMNAMATAIEQMPSSWFTNDDDYVDSFYTIEKGTYYYNYNGAAQNAKVTLVPYNVQPN